MERRFNIYSNNQRYFQIIWSDREIGVLFQIKFSSRWKSNSYCWDQIPRTCHVFARLFTSNTPWYFLDFTWRYLHIFEDILNYLKISSCIWRYLQLFEDILKWIKDIFKYMKKSSNEINISLIELNISSNRLKITSNITYQ